MTTLFAQVPVDRITARAREVHFGHTVLTVLAGLLYGLGWLVAKVFTLMWLAVTWSATAVRVGWEDARSPMVEQEPQEPLIPGPPGMPNR